jgi:hypothetical protein
MMRVVLLTSLFLLPCGQAIGQSAQPTKIRVRGVELHYIEQGQGSVSWLDRIRRYRNESIYL